MPQKEINQHLKKELFQLLPTMRKVQLYLLEKPMEMVLQRQDNLILML
jgi:hypothetical protein